MEYTHKVTIIGSGPGGYRAAILAALRGLNVAIIEKADWGGCCLNRGCVPKKAWHYTAKQISNMKHFANRGIAGELSANLEKAWEHQEKVVAEIQESYIDYMKRIGIHSYIGYGRLEDPHTISIDNNGTITSITSEYIIIATGSEPFIPDRFKLIQDKIITSDELFDKMPPKGNRVGIIGSGIIGSEFAYILKKFAKDIYWFARSEPLRKTKFSSNAFQKLREVFQEEGIHFTLGLETMHMEITQENTVMMHLNDDSQQEVDWVLLATGRKPYTHNLGLEKVGITTDDKGFIQHNEYLQTNQSHIYAIGDVAHEQMTANQAIADGVMAIENIITGNTKTYNPHWVPTVVYSALEMSHIGLNEDLAEEEGFEPAIGFASFEHSPRALGQDETKGFVRLIADMDSGELLGGEIIGDEAGEMIHMLSLYTNTEEILQHIAHGIYNHPTKTEEFINATETLANKWNLSEFIFDTSSHT